MRTDASKVGVAGVRLQKQEERKMHDEYELVHNSIYSKTPSRRRWVIPKHVRRQVFMFHHDGKGCLDSEKTQASIGKMRWYGLKYVYQRLSGMSV